MKRKIVVIETSDVGARYTGLAIRQLGFEPLFVVNSIDQYQADTRSQLAEFDILECGNTKDAENIILALSNLPVDNIEAVTTLLDSRIPIAQKISKILSVKGLDEALWKVCEKELVVKIIPEYSPLSVIVSANKVLELQLESIDDAERLIVKPSRGAGALGCRDFIRSEKRTGEIKRHILEQSNQLEVDKFLIQENLTGRLVSLEGYVIGGNCYFLGFSLRKKVGQTESANFFPGDEYLPVGVRDQAKVAIKTLVERSEIKQGYFHSEFIVNEEVVKLIDANFGRIAGAAISEQMAVSFNVNPVILFSHVISVGCLGEKNPLLLSESIDTLSICYGFSKRDRLVKLSLPKEWSINHTQILEENTEIPAMGGDNWAWLGLVSGAAGDVLKLIDYINLETPHGPVKPCYLELGDSLLEW